MDYKAFDLVQFNRVSEARFLKIARVLIEDGGGTVPSSQLIADCAYLLDVSPETIKRYLVKHSSRFGPLDWENGSVRLRDTGGGGVSSRLRQILNDEAMGSDDNSVETVAPASPSSPEAEGKTSDPGSGKTGPPNPPPPEAEGKTSDPGNGKAEPLDVLLPGMEEEICFPDVAEAWSGYWGVVDFGDFLTPDGKKKRRARSSKGDDSSVCILPGFR